MAGPALDHFARMAGTLGTPGAKATLMKQNNSKSIANQIKQFEKAINNSLNSVDIKAAVVKYGYTVARLNEGKALVTTATGAVENLSIKTGEKESATDMLQREFKTAMGAYQDLAKVARAIFRKQPGHLTTLGLNEPMPRTIAEFSVAAGKLFNFEEYPDAVEQALADKGYDSGRFSQERAKITAFDVAREFQAACVSAAEDGHDVQTEALKDLSEWSMEYRKIARVALKNRPQWLEALGVVQRSAKTKAQRAAPAKAAVTRAKNKALKKAA